MQLEIILCSLISSLQMRACICLSLQKWVTQPSCGKLTCSLDAKAKNVCSSTDQLDYLLSIGRQFQTENVTNKLGHVYSQVTMRHTM